MDIRELEFYLSAIKNLRQAFPRVIQGLSDSLSTFPYMNSLTLLPSYVLCHITLSLSAVMIPSATMHF